MTKLKFLAPKCGFFLPPNTSTAIPSTVTVQGCTATHGTCALKNFEEIQRSE